MMALLLQESVPFVQCRAFLKAHGSQEMERRELSSKDVFPHPRLHDRQIPARCILSVISKLEPELRRVRKVRQMGLLYKPQGKWDSTPRGAVYRPWRASLHCFFSFTWSWVACKIPMNMHTKPPQVKTI